MVRIIYSLNKLVNRLVILLLLDKVISLIALIVPGSFLANAFHSLMIRHLKVLTGIFRIKGRQLRHWIHAHNDDRRGTNAHV